MRLAIALLLGSMALPLAAQAQTREDLLNDGKNPAQVTTYGMGYHQQRHSRLDQINRSNVRRLVPVWSLSMSNDVGEQSQPLVYDGVMIVTNVRHTTAIDVATGRMLWRTPVEWDPATARVVCCGLSNRGAAIYEGKVFRTTIDAHVLALDLKTGKELWNETFADWTQGISSTVAPTIADGVLITGMSGAEFGVRGFIDGWDPATGKHLWRRFTIPGPGEPGSETWPKETEHYKHGGGTTWMTGSYDPELNLVYWGTGNAGPWNPTVRPGDSKHAASVIAIRPKTGEIAWSYQWTPGDMYDYDGVNENILADLTVEGQPRKALIHADRNGFLYVLDRTNGKPIAAHPFEKVTWAEKVDLGTGRPVETELAQRMRKGETLEVWPGLRGGKNWPPMAFNPDSGLVFVNTLHDPRSYTFNNEEQPKPGMRYLGLTINTPPKKPGEPWGFTKAIDPLTGKVRWEKPSTDYPAWGGMLSTGSGLLFTGRSTGEFQALDQENGQVLWSFNTGTGVNAPPVTYMVNGKQYVTVLAGLGGLPVIAGAPNIRERVPTGAAVWTFAVMAE
ncbi:PQQ-dependent dehydrogenase, methanol/ethanol family [Paracraurococcus lichenis]|uniref:PQQ-dependent dehydrogenase, methanol/ethanol family n=1 Tax=Paracraurococcus lichenis TaxID=3064888 RepID=A0ABT9E493_9PROT|nr:PQQ-dependent dehydrogenase, methanol/ethanol family [Paracraurococcus sp. LOR1-02]MDO9710820.1 PQQ-dependent dehydrogenase, methanol/ethanol family [Paracraurococcus sp. LOR1-02]